jgi:hypothetical protein
MRCLAAQHTQPAAQPSRRFARARQLGIGVLIAFTVKGICTTAMILAALFAAVDDNADEMFPHLLVWTVACIGGFCMLGGWRIGRRRQAAHARAAGAVELKCTD